MANSRQGIQENNPRQGQKSNVSQKKGRSGDHQEKDMLDYITICVPDLEKCLDSSRANDRSVQDRIV